MGDLIEEVDEKELIHPPSNSKSLEKGLIEFVKMGEQKTIPIHTTFGILHIRKPTVADEVASMQLRKEYDGVSESDWKRIKSVFLTSCLIVKPEISFEELIAQPIDVFIEIAQNITEKLPEVKMAVDDESLKKK